MQQARVGVGRIVFSTSRVRTGTGSSSLPAASSFSTSAVARSRIRPTLTINRPKQASPRSNLNNKSSSNRTQVHQQQEVIPPNPSSNRSEAASHAEPVISRVIPRDRPQFQERGGHYYDRLNKHDRHGPFEEHPFSRDRHRHRHRQSHHHHHGHHNNAWWYHPFWAQFAESRRAGFQAFVAGALLTVGSVTAYTTYGTSPDWTRNWTDLHRDFSQIRSSLTQSSAPPSDPSKAKPASPLRLFSSTADEDSSTSPHKQLRMFTSEQVEAKLAQNQKVFRLLTKEEEKREKDNRELILGYSVNQVASNNPVEDDMSRHVIRDKDGRIEKAFFGVFDGHGGWCCSQRVAQELAPTIAEELGQVKDPRDVLAVMEAIENGFLTLDHRIVHETVQKVLEFPSRPLACSSLLPAISGSCALMAYIDTKERDLYVACVGDSRAVLGVREPSETKPGQYNWRAMPLSSDQTGRSKSEVRRMRLEHPGEENTVIMRGRVLGGLEPTRAFGDARYKWSKEIQEKVFQLFPSYRQPHRYYNTPPYVTAKPVVRHHKLRPEDQFLVMATDGLWDKLTTDEVIQLVGDLLDGKTGKETTILDREEILKYKAKLKETRKALAEKLGLPPPEDDDDDEELTPANMAPKGPGSQIRRFSFKDASNASTHLVRNALGGADEDRLAATLSIPSPMSRYYRDDITVTVIFFGNQSAKAALPESSQKDDFVNLN
ncbi:hypothetical protein BGW38_003434 [Lunasporangiospora selenospora]|uniref:PPM-type phosphatase domain-containing protein n=1 Tax=Lunasporangiospora selenospora TaxID=979761 RepID=A0A9P6FRG1_9FUNG|nr:hypothetical protein BGW38_003434 [Lunasporangiospora selenospora]